MLLSFKCKRLDIAILLSIWMGAFTEIYVRSFLNFEKKKFLSHSFYNNLKTIDLRVTQKPRIILLWILMSDIEWNIYSQKNFSSRHRWQILQMKISVSLPFFCLLTNICILYTKIFIFISSLILNKIALTLSKTKLIYTKFTLVPQ